MGDCVVYVTGGMSDKSQPGTEEFDEEFQRIELSAYAPDIVLTDSGKGDFIGWVLGWMAHYPFEEGTYFIHGQTFDWGGPITPGSAMHGFYFAGLPFVDEFELCQQSGTALSIVHLVTVSKAELDYRMKHGTEALLALLEEGRVPPFFDLNRRCTIEGEQGSGGNSATLRASP